MLKVFNGRIGKLPWKDISGIDGSHPFQEMVHGSFVSYQARRRKKGKIAYFNFPLAKEMGLIPAYHEHELNPDLERDLLEAFCIQIINEYDLEHEPPFPKDELKDKLYMATRYLQLQHPDRIGLNSGDGRSVWNGSVLHKGQRWDVSSCGTGATCLSPAAAIHQKFYQTGDPSVSYGCGLSTVSEGLVDVLFSEILTKNRIETERVLCIVSFPDETGITVRAGKNLLRPSHFFNHLKQGQWHRLRDVSDYYIHRQVENGVWQIPNGKNPYDFLAERMMETFAEIAAKFETHYIFCWLDWDGDNVLADGGIIDFGSVRQFGLYYHEYQFDDDDRWSTNIKQQKAKARYTVQSFLQAMDYVKTGKKKQSIDSRDIDF